MRGWRNESARHALAAYGIKSKRYNGSSRIIKKDPYEWFGETTDRYGRRGHMATRVVWNYNPGEPLQMIPLDILIGEDVPEGFYGIHVGDEEWLPILCEDYGRDPTAQLATIDIDGMLLIDDPCPMDKGECPDSTILVWTEPEITPDRILDVETIIYTSERET